MTQPLVTSIDAVRLAVDGARQSDKPIGLVPTMGALHAGHASLIKAARAQTGFVVVSIFVNPTQFGPSEDLARYPRSLENDLQMCAAHQADIVFGPPVTEIYPHGFCTYVEVAELQDVLCGSSRPGHFRGVATVVMKLFNIVRPDVAFFGQKDAQQLRIIQQMTADLNVPVKVVACPTIRAPDGLALSSRNDYLDANQRRHAPVLFQSLQEAQERIQEGELDAAVIVGTMKRRIQETPGAELDYAAAVDADRLQPMERLQGRVLIAIAVRFGSTRLIDNIVLDINHPS